MIVRVTALLKYAGRAGILATYVLFLTGCSTLLTDQFEPDFDHITSSGSDPVSAGERETAYSFSSPGENGETMTGLIDGDTLSISLEDAVMLALQNNRELHMARLNPVVAGAYEAIARADYDPTLYISFSDDDAVGVETFRSTGEQFNSTRENSNSRIGISQKLPTGTDVDVSISQNRQISSSSPEQETARVGMTVTQSLLRGFGPVVNLASVRQAAWAREASIHELQGFTEALLINVEQAYWGYVLAREEMAIVERSLQVARQQLDVIEQRIEVGALPRTEAAAVKAEMARRKQALIDARGNLEERRLRLIHLLNPGKNNRIDVDVLATTDPQIDPEAIENVDDRIALAALARPDLNEARLQLKQDRLETIVTRNGLLPRLDFFFTLGQSGFSDTFSKSFREIDSEYYDLEVGLTFSQAWGNREARAEHLIARATEEQSSEALNNLEQIVELDVRVAINEVERARQQIGATRETRILEEETVMAEQERFEVGSSTALQVAQAQRDLLASRIDEVGALIEYRTALVKLYLAEGSLLQRRGIVVE